MDELLDSIKELHKKDLELSLKLEYSVHYGWIVKVIRKGYDMPIIETMDEDLNGVINKAYAALKVQL